MDVVKVIGIASYSFKAQDGNQIEGFKYHCTAPAPTNNPNFVGQQVLCLSVSLAARNQWLNTGLFVPNVGDECMVFYNRYGKVDQFGALPGKDAHFPNEHEGGKK